MKQQTETKQGEARRVDIVETLVVLSKGNFIVDAGREAVKKATETEVLLGTV